MYHSFRTRSLSFVQVVDFAIAASTAARPLVCKSPTASAAQSNVSSDKDSRTVRSLSVERETPFMAVDQLATAIESDVDMRG